MTETQRVVLKMLKTSTGSHFLDSGGAYGRHWERNQKRQFAKEPEVALDVMAHKWLDEKTGELHERVELNPSINVYHFLSEAVEFAPKLDKEFQAFAGRPGFADTGSLEIAETFAEKHWEHSHTFNTYNGEDWLSQVLQGVIEGEYVGYLLLQIHQGCDVRGGYTKPRAFRWSSDWYPCLWDNAKALIYCQGHPVHEWQVEPGYCQGISDEPGLDSFPMHVLDANERAVTGKLCARDDEAFCPLCASKLAAGF